MCMDVPHSHSTVPALINYVDTADPLALHKSFTIHDRYEHSDMSDMSPLVAPGAHSSGGAVLAARRPLRSQIRGHEAKWVHFAGSLRGRDVGL